jgi:hypothetical protein
MLMINADDWGRSEEDTDAALACIRQRRITSVSAMVFMKDSARAADLAKAAGLDVGLHLNFTEAFTGEVPRPALQEALGRTARFLGRSRYSVLVYHPRLRHEFDELCRAQRQEFARLYGRGPTHVDGHQHMHLCANVLLDACIPIGEVVRRSFSFFAGDKSVFNRLYRSVVDRSLARRYRLVDFFFGLPYLATGQGRERFRRLAATSHLEVMAHPRRRHEFDYLMSDAWLRLLDGLQLGCFETYAAVRDEPLRRAER